MPSSNWWCEEVEILCEEMQHSLRSLKYEAGQWEEQAQQDDTCIAEEVCRGRRAYAMKQAMLQNRTWHVFEAKWHMKGSAPNTYIIDSEAEALSLDDDDISSANSV